MMEIRRILCPTDFSDCSRRALDHAVAIAKSYQSTITLFHVCAAAPVPSHAPGVLRPVMLVREDQDAALATMKEFAKAEVGTSLPLQFDIGEGHVANGIVSKAIAMPADLLALGTHGRSGFDRLLLGSVTEKVLRKAACPVLTVPPAIADVVPVPSSLFKRILCAIDFSECSMRALDHAVSIARHADAQLTVLHVIEVPDGVPHGRMPGTGWSVAEYFAAIEADRRESLARAVPQDVRTRCKVATVLVTGKPRREIVRVASDRQSDVIVIGVHGRGAADLLFFGSTAEYAVRHATCPVLTLRTP